MGLKKKEEGWELGKGDGRRETSSGDKELRGVRGNRGDRDREGK